MPDNLQFGSVNGTMQGRQSISGVLQLAALSGKEIVSNTVAGWNAQSGLVSAKNIIYVYTDYKVVDGQPVPNIKIGDGNAYLIDLPFVVGETSVTQEQIEFWNGKASVMIDPFNPERLVFYTD